MLPERGDPHGSQGKRQDYLSLPYNSPIRRAFRGVEEQIGQLFFDQNARAEASGGFFTGFFAVVGGIAGFIILGPGGVLAGAAFGAGAGTIADAVVSARLMTRAEWILARKVFGSSLPDYNKILFTDFGSLNGRAFTYPASTVAQGAAFIVPTPMLIWMRANPGLFDGKILVNMNLSMDRNFDQYSQGPKTRYAVPGQMMIHELAHVWQIHHGSPTGFLCDGLAVQTRDALGENVYAVAGGKQWREYGLEQQASLVDLWYQIGSHEFASDPYYRYIAKNIRPGDPNASSSDPPVGALAASENVRVLRPIATVTAGRLKGFK